MKTNLKELKMAAIRLPDGINVKQHLRLIFKRVSTNQNNT
jgi:hypothetical protein